MYIDRQRRFVRDAFDLIENINTFNIGKSKLENKCVYFRLIQYKLYETKNQSNIYIYCAANKNNLFFD